ncbi:MAG: phosphopentomutase [Eubacteriales bacterium]|nr:phosphopentomutase [Eubacteriales bacterium]
MRVFWVVLDGAGVGAQEDAARYGDAGADTLGHVLAQNPQLSLPVMRSMGLYHIEGTSFFAPQGHVVGCFGRQRELSAGKDTTTGHWEMAGCVLREPFPTFPNGFPPAVLEPFCRLTGRGILGNKPASGTQIIEELGEEHLRTGKLIVYTSADSVFQIAAHTDVLCEEELYRICREARALLQGDYQVGRVIARPFCGTPGNFYRTPGRRDFSLAPPQNNLLLQLQKNGVKVCAIGKISDIFAASGISESLEAHGNDEVRSALERCVTQGEAGLYMANLVDFDMLYGHRNDVAGYAAELAVTDAFFGALRKKMLPQDVLIITADHGCDPAFPGSDHTREFVPVLIWSPQMTQGTDFGTADGYTHLAATAAKLFGLDLAGYGTPYQW